MPSNCPELKRLLEQIEEVAIPTDLRAEIEAHLESCHTCRADLNQFIKIGNILQKTVYSDPAEDRYISFLRHLDGRRLRWGTHARPPQKTTDNRRMLILLLKLFLGFLVAAGAGASLAVLLGYFGVTGKNRPAVTADSLGAVQSLQELSSTPVSEAVTPSQSVDSSYPVPDSVTPEAVSVMFDKEQVRSSGTETLAPGDSSRLHGLEAEQSALRDALSRSPSDSELLRRTVDKARQVLEERRRLGLASRAGDYYNLGLAHYLGHEYRQTMLVTTEGIQSVKIGPTEYLHYLKAMSHYRLAQRMLQPLPADSSATEEARLKGAILRSELDSEARGKAVTELRRAIGEFGYLLNRPELAQIGRSWILSLNEQIATLSTG